MSNPWQEIDLNAYESHMSLGSVAQLQALNRIMKAQLSAHPADTVMILGIAGGNGLEHIDPQRTKKVYGVDINPDYLKECCERYPALDKVFEPVCCDVSAQADALPKADLLIADLFVEYVGCACFARAVAQVSPEYVSVVIQLDTGKEYVSDSPYIHVFDRLDEIHSQINENELESALRTAGYIKVSSYTQDLPNGKQLARLDLMRADK